VVTRGRGASITLTGRGEVASGERGKVMVGDSDGVGRLHSVVLG
jgi:hypothetical protein